MKPIRSQRRRRWVSMFMSGILLLSIMVSASANDLEQAKQHFSRGVELYNEGSFTAALAELQRAYELSQNYVILYNMGLVQLQLSDFVGAIKSFTRYLKDGGRNIKPERQKEVENRLNQLKNRIATLEIKSNVNDIEMYLDDEVVESFQPSVPISINPGRHKVTVTKQGYTSAIKFINAVGNDKISLSMELTQVAPPVTSSAPTSVEPPVVPSTLPSTPPSSIVVPPIQSTVPPEVPPPSTTNWAPILSWITTGLVGGAALTTGLISLAKSNELREKRDTTSASSSELNSLYRSSQNFALATDILTGAAIVGVGVSLFLTLRTSEKKLPTKANVSVGVGLGTFIISGHF